MSFESNLKEGIFSIPQCKICSKIVWPPSKFCSFCFGDVTLQKGTFHGTIKEFSSQDNRYFCIVEFKGVIKIMATMTSMPKINQTVKITKCGINNNGYFFHVSEIL